MKDLKVSVCMATYNGERYIREQLDSILRQLRPNDEIVISDDSSTDHTLEIISSYKDKRIKLYHASFRDVRQNFENALGKATGNIIFLSDQDDIWFGDKVDRLVEILVNHDLVFTNVCVFSDAKEDCNPLYDIGKNYNGLAYNYLKNHCIGATMAFRKEVLEYALPFPRNIEMHDMWIFFITSIYGRTYYLRDPLVYYRKHESNVTNTGERTTNSWVKIIAIRLNWIYFLTTRVIQRWFQK